MTLQVIPPELVQPSAGSTDKKPFDSLELLPNKLASGESVEVRLLGNYGTGHMSFVYRCPIEEKQADGTLRFAGYDFSADFNGFPNAARATDWSSPTREKLDEKVRPKRCLCALVYNYTTERVEVALIEQRAIRDSLVEVLSDEDYTFDDNDIATFTLKLGRQGEGLETSYSALPKSGKKPEASVVKAFAAVRDTSAMSLLLEGKHPLRKPKAEFETDTSDSEF